MAEEKKIWFPAAYSDNIIRFVANSGLLPHTGILLDPMAGIGRVHYLASASLRTVGVEIEHEWARCHPHTIQGNALQLPFRDSTFDAVVCSPVYGNRMSDHHNALDVSIRRSYTHDLRRMTGDSERQLHRDNAGTLYAWKMDYWRFHVRAWSEVQRVLRPGGVFLLNVSDFMRTKRGKQQIVPVVRTHARTCIELGFKLRTAWPITTPRLRHGQNYEARVDGEWVLELRR